MLGAAAGGGGGGGGACPFESSMEKKNAMHACL